MADKINQAADMINNSIVEVEDNGESKACDIIKDDETRKICVNSCFPSMILA
ncbi:MAG: hypothetical protein LBC61_01420 [Candidatus Peribacteria bacterium]|jgi:hypothetical protein|nr:hypothetical protein [Candidatus Peribacteria bacterium]